MRKLLKKNCKKCGNLFYTFDSEMEFCNLGCKADYIEEKEKWVGVEPDDLEEPEPAVDVIESDKNKVNKNVIKEKTVNKSLSHLKICVVCNLEFAPRNKNQLCCSKDCSKIYNREKSRKSVRIRNMIEKAKEKIINHECVTYGQLYNRMHRRKRS